MTVGKVMRSVIFFFTLVLALSVSAQTLSVKAEIDTAAIKIGEQAHIRLSAFFTQGTEKQIAWPQIKDTITSTIEVVSKSKIDTHTVASGHKIYSQEITVTSFDSGYHAMPPFVFSVKGDSTDAAETEPLLLEVITVPVDTTKAIKDIKGPIDAPFSWREAIPYIIGAVILVAIIFFIIYLIRRSRRKVTKVEEPVPTKDPDVIALEQIEMLEQEKLWQSGKIKEYYIRLSDIMRIYTEQRYHIPAMEQTSDELLQSLRSLIDDAQRSKLRQILLLSDLVKFAKELPIGTENEISLKNAKDFIHETKPVQAKHKEGEQ